MRWHFDPTTAIFTLLVAPVFVAILKITARHIKTWAAFATEGILYWAGASVRKSLGAALSLKRYGRLILAGPSKELYVPASTDVTLQIDDIYVPLMLQHQGSEKETFSHGSVLKLGGRMRIIGDPGSGKSSFIKRVLRDAARHAIERSAEARLPIWYELKHLRAAADVADAGQWFYDRLKQQAASTDVYGMAECFDSYAATNGLLILLDGLDEIPTADYEAAERCILDLSRVMTSKGPNNTIIPTSRIQFHQQVRDAFRDSFPHVLTLKPFTPTDIYEFLGRWPFRQSRARSATRIFGELTDRPSLRELCSNPLILSMYVADAEARGTFIAPDSRTEFYSRVSEELLIRRRLKQTGPTLAPTVLRQQRERILGTLAYDHLMDPHQPANSLSYDRAIETIKVIVGCDSHAASDVFDEIAKETGLISEERRAQSFRFIHLTFCEYFAAVEAVQGRPDGWPRLVDTHRELQARRNRQYHSRLLEVLPFAAQLLPRVQQSNAIEAIAAIDDARLLARVFFETKLYSHKQWQLLTARQEKYLLKVPESQWDGQWLSELHLLQVVMRDAEQSLAVMAPRGATATTSALDTFFEKLVKKQRRSLARLLSAYAERDAAAVFRVAEICHIDLAEDYADVIIRNADQMPFLALIRDAAASDTTRVHLWASILSEAALRSPVVRLALQNDVVPMQFAAIANAVKPRDRWWAAGIVPRNAITETLTVAFTGPLGNDFVALHELEKMPRPGRFRLSLWWPFAVSILCLALAASIQARWSNSFVIVGIVITCMVFAYAQLFRVMTIRIVYRRLLKGHDLGEWFVPSASADASVAFPGFIMVKFLPRACREAIRDTYLARGPRVILRDFASNEDVLL
jgi:hypothetical protein